MKSFGNKNNKKQNCFIFYNILFANKNNKKRNYFIFSNILTQN